MRINAVSSYSTIKQRKLREATTPITTPVETTPQAPTGMAMISFKSGNKSQVMMLGVEVPPYNKSGGVATVMQDFRSLRIQDSDPIVTNAMKNSYEFYKQDNKVLVDPIYNAFKSYSADGVIEKIEVPKIPMGLPEDSPFKKYEGRYFQTTSDKFQKYNTIEEFFKKENLEVANINGKGVKGNVFILDPVSEKKILDFGGLGDSETRLFRVNLEVNGNLRKTNDFKVFTDLTASLATPYEQGGYSTVPGKVNQTWKGVADAKAMKSIVEFVPTICEEVSKDGVKFDPATIILNDSQAGYATEYMAQNVVKGNDFWKAKKAVFIGHNLGEGYVQRTSYMNMFMNIADKELRNAVYNDAEFTAAAKEGAKDVENYFKKLLPKECLDLQEQVSPFKNTIYWTEKGLVTKIMPVSEKYEQALTSDPEFAPSIHKYLKELKEKGRVEGNLNAFENVEFDPTSNQGPPGYFSKTYEVDVNGKKIKIEPLSVFDAEKIKEGSVDTAHVREIKRQNKFKVLQRFDQDLLKTLTKQGNEKLHNEIILGLGGKNAEVHGFIKKEIIEEAAKANSKVKMISGWGRIDPQKAMDSAMLAFVEHLKNNPEDKHSVLFIGGPNNSESKKCIDIIKQYSKDKDVAGRMVFIDGFLPNKPFASASDFTVFPSRFAPCELTDLESVKMFASPIVTDIQGLSQKNFDATFAEELVKTTGYKTKHSFTIHLDELKALLKDDDKKDLEKSLQKFYDGIKEGMRGKEVTDAMIQEKIMKDGTLHWKYNYEVLRPFRDKLIEEELAGLYKRALIEDNGKPIQDQMIQNLRKMKTEWENNQALKPDNISSAQKYRNAFKADPAIIKEEDTLLYKLRKNCEQILNRAKQEGNTISSKPPVSGTTEPVTSGLKSKGGKIALGIAAAIAVLGAGYALFKKSKAPDNNNATPNFANVPKPAEGQAKNLSAVV